MPQPAITGTPPILQFGGQVQPNGQGTLVYVNLNDVTNWTWMQWAAGQADSDYPLHMLGRYLWRSRGTFLGQDAGSRKIAFPMRYRETNAPLGAALAKLSQAGQQFLTFDNLTGIPVKFAAAKRRALLLKYAPYYWGLDLEFIAPSPYFQDLTATSLSAVSAVQSAQASVLSAGQGGGAPLSIPPSLSTAPVAQGRRGARVISSRRNPSQLVVGPTTLSGPVSFSIAYAGSVWSEPVWTLTIPATNTGVITTATLTNTLSGAQAIMQLGGLAASTAYTITMDAGAMTITDQNGKAYDNTGNSFPLLYGPPGQLNTFILAVTVSSGQASGVTLGGSWSPRWEI